MESKHLISNARTLRKNMTQEERKLWHLFLKTLPMKFRRQSPKLGYILDFYAPSIHLAIELDGSQHYEPVSLQYDAHRTQVLQQAGIQVLRFTNLDVQCHFPEVCTAIHLAIAQLLASPSQGGGAPAGAEGASRQSQASS